MNILLTNDDSIYSEGIYALNESLRKIGNVIVVAPAFEQSAVGHGITMTNPLRVKTAYRRMKIFGYAVSGTPADCVKLAVMTIAKKKIDFVVSGINMGPNVGFSVLYSGTVSGALEGAILGMPSIAVSLGTYANADYRFAADFTAKAVKMTQKIKLPKGVLLNINVPALSPSKIKGVKITKQGKSPMIERHFKRIDPRKNAYYWLSGEAFNLKGDRDSDIEALKKGYISITPLKYDLTDYGVLKEAVKWRF